MLVNSVSKQAFGLSQVYRDVLLGKRNFYSLSTDDKLNVIYDKLNSLEKDHRGLSENQIKMNDFNKHAFDCIVAASARNNHSADTAYSNIGYQYDKNNIDLVG